jgi:hypothetical protein
MNKLKKLLTAGNVFLSTLLLLSAFMLFIIINLSFSFKSDENPFMQIDAADLKETLNYPLRPTQLIMPSNIYTEYSIWLSENKPKPDEIFIVLGEKYILVKSAAGIVKKSDLSKDYENLLREGYKFGLFHIHFPSAINIDAFPDNLMACLRSIGSFFENSGENRLLKYKGEGIFNLADNDMPILLKKNGSISLYFLDGHDYLRLIRKLSPSNYDRYSYYTIEDKNKVSAGKGVLIISFMICITAILIMLKTNISRILRVNNQKT